MSASNAICFPARGHMDVDCLILGLRKNEKEGEKEKKMHLERLVATVILVNYLDC